MPAKPNQFKKNTAEMFITPPETPPATTPAENYTPPAGYRLQKEYKSERMQLLIRPNTKKMIKKQADAQGISMNDLVNQILDEYVERISK